MTISTLKNALCIICLGSFLFLLFPISGQAQQGMNDTTGLAKLLEKIITLEDILQTTPNLEEELEKKRNEQLNEALTEEEKSAIAEEVEQFNHQLDNLNKDLIVISTGIDPAAFFEKPVDPELDWNSEIKEIFYPALEGLKSATNRSREIERLRNETDANKVRLQQIAEAITKLKELAAHSKSPLVNEHLTEQLEFWQKEEEELLTKHDAVRLHLEEIQNQSKGLMETLKAISRSFMNGHAKNLMLAIFALLGTFFFLRLIHRALRKKIQTEKSKNWHVLLRIADLFYYIFTIIASFTFFMMVLYSASDWLLLGIFIILMIGLIWVGKNALPNFFDQAKLLLDLGPVREGERLVYNGMPWRVESLDFYTYLHNPALDSNHVILPLGDLVGLRSRPYGESEPWFPSNSGDYVVLDDGFFGQVISQSPDTIVVEVERGSLKSYSIDSYLANNPQNISRHYFSVAEIVGIDYQYRDRITDELCPKLETMMAEKLKAEPYGEWVHQIRVELEKMNDSSLDLEFFVKFKGGAAPEYVELPGRVQQLALKCLNQLDIDIPFPHLTILRP